MPRVLLTALFFAAAASACSGPPAATTDVGAAPPANNPATVVRVTDGDTIVTLLDGEEVRVRLIGVNAPESGECLAEESKKRLEEILQGKQVRLETDVEESDRFGRMPAYLWAEEVLVNERLAAEGLVLSRPYPPNTLRQSELDAAAASARRTGRGMWAPDACGPPTGVKMEITEIQWNPPGPDEEDLNGEYIVLRNLSDQPARLDGFTLRDTSSSNRFRFPDGWTLPGGAETTIRTGDGPDGRNTLYWGSELPVWNNNGDAAILQDPSGNIIAHRSYTN